MENEECGEAFVVGVRKGRVRELGARSHAREKGRGAS